MPPGLGAPFGVPVTSTLPRVRFREGGSSHFFLYILKDENVRGMRRIYRTPVSSGMRLPLSPLYLAAVQRRPMGRPKAGQVPLSPEGRATRLCMRTSVKGTASSSADGRLVEFSVSPVSTHSPCLTLSSPQLSHFRFLASAAGFLPLPVSDSHRLSS